MLPLPLLVPQIMRLEGRAAELSLLLPAALRSHYLKRFVFPTGIGHTSTLYTNAAPQAERVPRCPYRKVVLCATLTPTSARDQHVIYPRPPLCVSTLWALQLHLLRLTAKLTFSSDSLAHTHTRTRTASSNNFRPIVRASCFVDAA